MNPTINDFELVGRPQIGRRLRRAARLALAQE